MLEGFQRIVTGHDPNGSAVILSAGPPDRVVDLTPHGPRFYEIWNTLESPVHIDRDSLAPEEGGLQLVPPPGGTRIRVLDIQPETPETTGLSPEEGRRHFQLVGAESASTSHSSSHPFMHRTETIDYGIVLQGEIFLIVDQQEILCRQGDIVIQRGTNHAWANRSDGVCRIAFILIDGKYEASLECQLSSTQR